MERKKNLGIDLVATGNRIQNAMKRKSYTAKEIAVMMGLSYQSVWKWCKGESIPDVENLLILSRILEVSMDSLVVSFESLDKRIDELIIMDLDWKTVMDDLLKDALEDNSCLNDYIVDVQKRRHYVMFNKASTYGRQRRLLNCLKIVT